MRASGWWFLSLSVVVPGAACKDGNESTFKRKPAAAVEARVPPLAASTGLAKAPPVDKECPDIGPQMLPKTQPPPPALAQGVHGGDALTSEDIAFMDQARQCRDGDSCLGVDEGCNCGFAINAKHADRFVADIRPKLKCAVQPCCTWGSSKGAAVCREGRCLFIDPAAELVAAALGSGKPPPCPDRDDERAKAKEQREVAGMAGLRGGHALTAGDVIVLKNSTGCAEGDACVRVEEPCNCGFTVNARKADAVRAVASRITCSMPACCRWKGPPVCRSDECQDTY